MSKWVTGEWALVTGAGGLVGKEVVKQLQSKYFVLGTDVADINKCHFLDVTRYSIVCSYLDAYCPSVVVHLAAKVAGPPSVKNPYDYYKVNVLGTLNVLEAMRQTDTKNLVYFSSWSIYGDNPTLPITENIQQQPTTPYGVSKLTSELLIRNYCDLYGLKAVIFRPTHIFGPEQKENSVVRQILNCMVTGEPFVVYGAGEHTKELLYVSDVGDAVERAVKYVTEMKGGCEVLVLGTEDPVSIKDLANYARTVQPFPIEFKEPKRVSFSQRSDCSEAKRRLGWTPKVSWQEGITRCWETKNKRR